MYAGVCRRKGEEEVNKSVFKMTHLEDKGVRELELKDTSISLWILKKESQCMYFICREPVPVLIVSCNLISIQTAFIIHMYSDMCRSADIEKNNHTKRKIYNKTTTTRKKQ